MNTQKILDADFEDIIKICGPYLPQNEHNFYLKQYSFFYSRSDGLDLKLYFSRTEFEARVSLSFRKKPISSISFKQCKAIKVIDSKKKIIEIQWETGHESSASAFINLLNDPILIFTAKNLMNSSLNPSDKFYDLDIVEMFDKMIENVEEQLVELSYRKEECSVLLKIFRKEHTFVLEIRQGDKIINILNFINFQLLHSLSTKNKCLEILGFSCKNQERIRCFIALNEELISIAQVETNYIPDTSL